MNVESEPQDVRSVLTPFEDAVLIALLHEGLLNGDRPARWRYNLQAAQRIARDIRVERLRALGQPPDDDLVAPPEPDIWQHLPPTRWGRWLDLDDEKTVERLAKALRVWDDGTRGNLEWLPNGEVDAAQEILAALRVEASE